MKKSGLTYLTRTDWAALPDWTAQLDTTFFRSGDSLMIVADSGEILIIRDYFSGGKPPVLRTESGQVVIPDFRTPDDEDGIALSEIEPAANGLDDALIAKADEAALAAKTAALIDGIPEEEAEEVADEAWLEVLNARTDEDVDLSASEGDASMPDLPGINEQKPVTAHATFSIPD